MSTEKLNYNIPATPDERKERSIVAITRLQIAQQLCPDRQVEPQYSFSNTAQQVLIYVVHKLHPYYHLLLTVAHERLSGPTFAEFATQYNEPQWQECVQEIAILFHNHNDTGLKVAGSECLLQSWHNMMVQCCTPSIAWHC